jgi:predicted flap endonuclease-1-like 5' DNA nuclease
MNDFINMLIGHITNSFVSTLMLGILTGWLIEWLFYNFIWKNSRTATNSEDKREAPSIAKGIVESKTVSDDKAEKTTEQISTEIKQEPQPSQQPTEQKANRPDDFTKLVGIGPSMDKRLKELEINSFLQLSEVSVETLMEQLTATGARVNNKTIMKSWSKQATLANSGDFDALESLQNTLKKG